jgi:hypothetical protein
VSARLSVLWLVCLVLGPLAACRPVASVTATAAAPASVQVPGCEGASVDADGDGLADACEALLAERFAPIVIHSSAETVFPSDVDDFLPRTTLAFRDARCRAGKDARAIAASPTQETLLGRSVASPCGTAPVTSDGSRSLGKKTTFFLTDIAEPARSGSLDSGRWKTYVHAFPNQLGGVTLQYWRFYPFNRAFGDHGGDWESAQVVLGRDLRLARVRLLGHVSIDDLSAGELGWEGTHPIIYSEIGGHSSRSTGDDIPARGCVDSQACAVNLGDLHTFIRQETWTGGRVVWADGRMTASGGLVDMGEKSAPRAGQRFVRYSGLWGSPGHFYFTSGYWGPAYNETSMRSDGFITAWCDGMAAPLQARECWADRTEP